MAKKQAKQIVENEDLENQVDETEVAETEEVNESPASETLHPGAGSNSGTMPRAEVAAKIMGALAGADRESLTRFWKETLSTHFGTDFGAHGREENASTIKAHPSDAVGKAVKEDIADMFKDQELSEEFKSKATIIFEAAINAKVKAALVEAADAYEVQLQEEVAQITEGLYEQVGNYLEYAADAWMTENEVAIESALRNEITTEFMSKLRDLFIESNVNIPEEQVEVVDALAEKVEELEARMAELVQENANLRESNEEAVKAEIVAAAKEGMTQVDAEKLDKLAEGVEAESAEEYAEKVKILAESLKPSTKGTGSKVQELLEEVDENNKVLVEEVAEPQANPAMKPYINAIRRTVKAS